MAHYLVTASPRVQLMDELRDKLARNEFVPLRPFGRALSASLRRARLLPNGRAMWEEETIASRRWLRNEPRCWTTISTS